MAERNYGLLMVMTQPAPAMEEEFNAWYDTEHLPERMALPGFLSGLRYVCLDGYPRYLALYDLDHLGAVETSEYKSISGDNFSQWTKRVTSRMPVWRIVATQAAPGNTVTARAARLLVASFDDTGAGAAAVAAGLARVFEPIREARQVRLFTEHAGDMIRHYGIAALAAPLSTSLEFSRGGEACEGLCAVNTYAPYSPLG